MSAVRHLKCLCEHCGGHIEFPIEGVGATVPCPHCGRPTSLVLPARGDSDRALHRTRLWAIGGVVVLVLLLVAAFVAVRMLQDIAPRVRRVHAVNAAQAAPTRIVTSEPIASSASPAPTAAIVAAESLPMADWMRTNDLAISPIVVTPRPGSALLQATGAVVNLLKRKRVGVVVEIELLDGEGNSLKQIRDYRPAIDPSASWEIRAIVADPKAKSARVLTVHEKR